MYVCMYIHKLINNNIWEYMMGYNQGINGWDKINRYGPRLAVCQNGRSFFSI